MLILSGIVFIVLLMVFINKKIINSILTFLSFLVIYGSVVLLIENGFIPFITHKGSFAPRVSLVPFRLLPLSNYLYIIKLTILSFGISFGFALSRTNPSVFTITGISISILWGSEIVRYIYSYTLLNTLKSFDTGILLIYAAGSLLGISAYLLLRKLGFINTSESR